MMEQSYFIRIIIKQNKKPNHKQFFIPVQGVENAKIQQNIAFIAFIINIY